MKGLDKDIQLASYQLRKNCELRMRRECRERFPHHRLQRKPLVSDPGMNHGTCVTHVPWCMSGSLTRGWLGNIPGIHSACATRNFTYLARVPWVVIQFIDFQRTYLTQHIDYYKLKQNSSHDKMPPIRLKWVCSLTREEVYWNPWDVFL